MLCKNYGIIHFTIGNYALLVLTYPENGGQVEDRLGRYTFLGSKVTSVRPLLVFKIYESSNDNDDANDDDDDDTDDGEDDNPDDDDDHHYDNDDGGDHRR